MRANRVRQRGDKRLDGASVGKQGPEVQPEPAVMARLEPEVSLPPADQAEQVGARRPQLTTSNVPRTGCQSLALEANPTICWSRKLSTTVSVYPDAAR